MKHKLNVNGDIESRRRIAERRNASATDRMTCQSGSKGCCVAHNLRSR